MINLNQLCIPGYQPVFKREVNILLRDGIRLLTEACLIPEGDLSHETAMFVRNLLSDLAEILRDTSLDSQDDLEHEIDCIIANLFPWSESDAIHIVTELECYQDDLVMTEVRCWNDVLRVAISQRALTMIEHLVVQFERRLARFVELQRDDINRPQREALFQAISAEVRDPLSERALSLAYEAAAWVETRLTNDAVQIAFALLKDGRTLEEAVETAHACELKNGRTSKNSH